MTTSTEFIDTLVSTTSSGIDRGKLRHLREVAKTQGRGGTVAESSFWDEFWRTSGSGQPQAVHDNPTRKPALRGKAAPLDASDLLWLQRLPTDPGKLSAKDAADLAGLAAQTTVGTGDHRLVHSILAPVQRHHARLEAEAALKNLQRPLPKIPDSAQPALAAVISRELPELTEDEAFNRAGQQIRTAIATRSSNQADQIHAIRAQLASDQQAVG